MKYGMKLLSNSQASAVPFKPFKFVNGQVISTHTFLGMWLLIDAGLILDDVIAPGGASLSETQSCAQR